VSDSGFPGMIIKMENSHFKISEKSIFSEAGARLSQIVNSAGFRGMTGFEWAVGIPGTVGGAIRGNAGAFGGCIGQIIEKVRFLDDNLEIKEIDASQCDFSYRNSFFKKNPEFIIVSASFKLESADKSEIESRMKEYIKKRTSSQPYGSSSAGSFFENPSVRNEKLLKLFEADTGIHDKNGKIAAGWLISEAGLLGKNVGGAKISEKHANFILNTGGATAQDVIILMCIVKQRIRNRFGINLKEEVQYVGFNN